MSGDEARGEHEDDDVDVDDDDDDDADDVVVVNRSGVETCFGCGKENPLGLRLVFRRVGQGEVETRHRVAPHHCGVAEVVHGGIQTTILDEVMGVAAQLALPPDAGLAPCVTVELSVRFRRPVPIGEEVVARARLVGVEGRDYRVEGEIRGADGVALTVASSRWRQLGG
ncbi:MAG: PaaI family thioesterase [Acidimicrobiales bacterium]